MQFAWSLCVRCDRSQRLMKCPLYAALGRTEEIDNGDATATEITPGDLIAKHGKT